MSSLTKLGQSVGLRSPESDDGGLSVQHVGPEVRALVGAIGVLSAGVGIYCAFEGEWSAASSVMITALLMGRIAMRGVRKEIDPVASEHFLELADPSRPLHPDEE